IDRQTTIDRLTARLGKLIGRGRLIPHTTAGHYDGNSCYRY
ncbi:unnamed protein product, partial [marine sediment metagenome]